MEQAKIDENEIVEAHLRYVIKSNNEDGFKVITHDFKDTRMQIDYNIRMQYYWFKTIGKYCLEAVLTFNGQTYDLLCVHEFKKFYETILPSNCARYC